MARHSVPPWRRARASSRSRSSSHTRRFGSPVSGSVRARRLQAGQQVGAVDRDRGLGGQQPQQLRRRARPASSRGARPSRRRARRRVWPSRTTGTQAADAAPVDARASAPRRAGRRRRRPRRRLAGRGRPRRSIERAVELDVMPAHGGADRGGDLQRVARRTAPSSTTEVAAGDVAHGAARASLRAANMSFCAASSCATPDSVAQVGGLRGGAAPRPRGAAGTG